MIKASIQSWQRELVEFCMSFSGMGRFALGDADQITSPLIMVRQRVDVEKVMEAGINLNFYALQGKMKQQLINVNDTEIESGFEGFVFKKRSQRLKKQKFKGGYDHDGCHPHQYLPATSVQKTASRKEEFCAEAGLLRGE